MERATYLLILGERQAVYWVLANSKTAFVATRAGQALQLSEGDRLLLYTTRGAWRNPTRDRGRVIGEATVTGKPSRMREPVTIAGREFGLSVDLAIGGVAPQGEGVELAALVPELDMFPDKRSWSAHMRTSMLAVPGGDYRVIHTQLAPLMQSLDDVLSGYRLAARLPA